MKTKKRNRVPFPFSKWIGLKAWKCIPKADRKLLTDLIKLQKSLPNLPKEEYHNWNAEIEYDRHEGLR